MVNATDPPPVRICIIGAGPAGLVALKTFVHQATLGAHYYPVLLEAEAAIGGTFRQRSYENAQLVSSKQLTCFSDFRLPISHPDHIDLPEYCEYLDRYVQHFDLEQYINLSCRVQSVRRDGRKHRVHWIDRNDALHEGVFDKLIICSGLHVTPSIPEVRGIHNIPERIHSSEYKSRKQLAGKNVLILGCGETAMDIAYEAIKSDCPQVVMAQRGGFLSMPKVLNRFSVFGYTTKAKLPIDGLITNLLETAYVHPWVAESRIRWHMSDKILQRVLWFLTGTKAGCNQYAGELPPERLGRAYVFLNKSSKAMPYINRPYKKRPKWMSYVTNYIDPIEDATSEKIIELAPFVCHVEDDGEVKFQRGGAHQKQIRARIKTITVKPDIVVYCTGYKQDLKFLSDEYFLPRDAEMRHVTSIKDTSVAYLGHVRPGVGAIPPIAEMQSMWLSSLWNCEITLPLSGNHYSLLHAPEARIQYGVDHGAYMSTLASDCHTQPDILDLIIEYGFTVAFTYAFGASFPTFYRLLGPHRMNQREASDIVTGELLEIIKRRGWIGNFFFAFIPMVFYFWVNMLALVTEQTFNAIQRATE